MRESSRLKFLLVLMATVINPRCQEAAEAHIKDLVTVTPQLKFCHVADVVGFGTWSNVWPLKPHKTK